MVVRSSGQKVKDLFFRIGAEDCLIGNEDDFNTFEAVAKHSTNWEIVNKNILNLRNRSAQLLDETLDTCKHGGQQFEE
jgi:hypothetical protein